MSVRDEIVRHDRSVPPMKPAKKAPGPARSRSRVPSHKPLGKRSRPGPVVLPRRRVVLIGAVEVILLTLTALIAVITVMGGAADWFGGTSLTQSLLPFAGVVLLLSMGGSLLLALWLRLRRRLAGWGGYLPLVAAFVVASGGAAYVTRSSFQSALLNLRTLVGGTEEAGRAGIGHQVFASYRRADLLQMQVILDRATPYLSVIRRAASHYGLDESILVGVGAAESSFLPRDSKDGGRGLFQITAIPRAVIKSVAEGLHTASPDARNPEHNIWMAAATLRHYLDQMNGDLFLGLLAYNIGPRNGGLRSIMDQYGARDFYTIQPYLKDLPRDYPVRVLTAALAYRLWRQEGSLPRYEDGQNARYIQSVGIPGLGQE